MGWRWAVRSMQVGVGPPVGADWPSAVFGDVSPWRRDRPSLAHNSISPYATQAHHGGAGNVTASATHRVQAAERSECSRSDLSAI